MNYGQVQEEQGCAFEFNIPTSFTTQEGYKKKEEESTNHSQYRFDIMPNMPCMNHSQAFQGYSAAGKRPPADLIQIEDFLRKSSLVIESNKAITDSKEHLKMPEILNNRVILPDCSDNAFQTTKTKRHEMPQYSNPSYPKGQYQTDFMQPGSNTRQEVKDQYKEWKDKSDKSYTIPLPKFRMPSLAPQNSTDLGNTISNNSSYYNLQKMDCNYTGNAASSYQSVPKKRF